MSEERDPLKLIDGVRLIHPESPAGRVILEARAEFEQEQFREKVEAEKARLRARAMRRTLWQRTLDRLPFTIVWKKR